MEITRSETATMVICTAVVVLSVPGGRRKTRADWQQFCRKRRQRRIELNIEAVIPGR